MATSSKRRNSGQGSQPLGEEVSFAAVIEDAEYQQDDAESDQCQAEAARRLADRDVVGHREVGDQRQLLEDAGDAGGVGRRGRRERASK